jgi:glycosyltransferase involved in cell wall biosynthesis
MNFSLIIPCYNEEKNIPLLLNKYSKFLKDNKSEIILVENGSTDGTAKVLKKINNKNVKISFIKKNIGYGYGLKRGTEKAKGKVIIFSHADLEVDPKDITKAIKIYKRQKFKIKEKVFIKGNRVNKLKNHWTISDIFFSYGLTLFSILLFRKYLFDIHGQPVLFNKSMLKEIKYFPNDFSVDLSFYLHAKTNCYKIIRFPVNFNKKKRYFGEGSSDSIFKKIKASIEQSYQSFIILNKS